MKFLFLTSVLLMFWIILTQSFYWPDILIGSLVSILSILLSRSFSRSFQIKLRIKKTMKYLLVLVPTIFVSGLKSLYMILTLKMEVKIVRVSTQLDHPFAIYILAMSITLTPGTITLYRADNTLYVLRLYPQGTHLVEEAEAIKSPFEEMLLEG